MYLLIKSYARGKALKESTVASWAARVSETRNQTKKTRLYFFHPMETLENIRRASETRRLPCDSFVTLVMNSKNIKKRSQCAAPPGQRFGTNVLSSESAFGLHDWFGAEMS